jgi:N-acetylglucosamine-6-phosphate deacetylase
MVARRLLSTGVTSFCPTLVSSSPETYATVTGLFGRLLKRLRNEDAEILAGSVAAVSSSAAVTKTDPVDATTLNFSGPATRADGRLLPAARVLGLHLEGPFIALEKRGAHKPEHVRAPGDAGAGALAAVYGPHADWAGGGVRLVTLAPELPGAAAALGALAARGVVACIGHTSADIRAADAAVSGGARMVRCVYRLCLRGGYWWCAALCPCDCVCMVHLTVHLTPPLLLLLLRVCVHADHAPL